MLGDMPDPLTAAAGAASVGSFVFDAFAGLRRNDLSIDAMQMLARAFEGHMLVLRNDPSNFPVHLAHSAAVARRLNVEVEERVGRSRNVLWVNFHNESDMTFHDVALSLICIRDDSIVREWPQGSIKQIFGRERLNQRWIVRHDEIPEGLVTLQVSYSYADVYQFRWNTVDGYDPQLVLPSGELVDYPTTEIVEDFGPPAVGPSSYPPLVYGNIQGTAGYPPSVYHDVPRPLDRPLVAGEVGGLLMTPPPDPSRAESTIPLRQVPTGRARVNPMPKTPPRGP